MTLTQSIIIIVGSLIVMAALGALLNRYLKGQKPKPEETPSHPTEDYPGAIVGGHQTNSETVESTSVRRRDPKTGRFIKG